MTNKSKKKLHKEIKDRLMEPKSEKKQKAIQEYMYGDENNPGSKLHSGDDWNLKPKKSKK